MFRVVLRDVTCTREQVDRVGESLRTHGFVNYFGMQRFGTSSVSTAEVGVALLRGSWDRAVSHPLDLGSLFLCFWLFSDCSDPSSLISAAPHLSRHRIGNHRTTLITRDILFF